MYTGKIKTLSIMGIFATLWAIRSYYIGEIAINQLSIYIAGYNILALVIFLLMEKLTEHI